MYYRAQQKLMWLVFRAQQTAYFDVKVMMLAILIRNNALTYKTTLFLELFAPFFTIFQNIKFHVMVPLIEAN